MNELKKVFIPVTTDNYNDEQEYGSIFEDRFWASSNYDDFVNNTKAYGLVLFTGGSDVSPSFYGDVGKDKVGKSHYYRDSQEKKVFEQALQYNIPMFGVCRGLQFLNVMHGGRLLHDVTTFSCRGTHTMYTHIYDKPIAVNSLHHQVCIPAKNGFIIGWERKKSNIYISGNYDKIINWGHCLVEAMLFPETKCAGVQYHPEMMLETSEGYLFAKDLLNDITNKDKEALLNKWTHIKLFSQNEKSVSGEL